MTEELRVLFLEDNLADYELEVRELRRGGLMVSPRCVANRAEFERELTEFSPDLIISDFSLSDFDGMAALRLARENRPECPFIFVSGTLGEERAIETLKNGATDYIVKGRMGGLDVKVRRALREVAERQERRKLEDQFRQAQKMEAVGRLAGGVAHDFNNLLTVILGYSEVLLGQVEAGSPLRMEIEEIQKAGTQAASLTRQLLAFSRKQVLQPRVVDLNAVLSGVGKMLRRLIGEDVEIVTALEKDLGRVKADVGQIEQVIVNLVINARDAMPQGGRLTLETANVELDRESAREHDYVRPGAYVVLAISDTGTGMSPEVKARLFEPFFTTKEQGKGTGLGLSTVYGIVKQSEGYIWVDSEPGRGTSFRTYLPRVDDLPEERAQPGPPSENRRGSETILLVEDAEAVRVLVRTVLTKAGYAILEARQGEEALRLCASRAGPIHLVITDLVMPEMSGQELVARLASLRTGLRTLYISGYTESAVLRNGGLSPDAAFLQKPFSADALLKKVREVLDAPR